MCELIEQLFSPVTTSEDVFWKTEKGADSAGAALSMQRSLVPRGECGLLSWSIDQFSCFVNHAVGTCLPRHLVDKVLIFIKKIF